MARPARGPIRDPFDNDQVYQQYVNWQDHIDSDPAVLGGKVRVKGTRIGVAFLLELFGAGWTQEQVLESYPHLTAEDLQAVFAFASETTEDVRLLPSQRPAA